MTVNMTMAKLSRFSISNIQGAPKRKPLSLEPFKSMRVAGVLMKQCVLDNQMHQKHGNHSYIGNIMANVRIPIEEDLLGDYFMQQCYIGATQIATSNS